VTTATGEPTDGFYDHVRELPDVRADLGNAHLQAAAVAAELDLDDAELWEQANGIVAALSAEANRWTEVLTGESATSPAVLAPPVVRLRELAVAQSRLLAALNGAMLSEQSAGPLLTGADRSARRVRMLGRRLQRTLRSTHWPGPLDEKHATAPAIQGDG
jgi:hypothetical protein